MNYQVCTFAAKLLVYVICYGQYHLIRVATCCFSLIFVLVYVIKYMLDMHVATCACACVHPVCTLHTAHCTLQSLT